MLLTLLSQQGSTPPVPVVEIDGHDGKWLADRLARERRKQDERRQRVLDLYERVVEGKEPVEPVVEVLARAGIEDREAIIDAPEIDLGRMLAALERAIEIAAKAELEQDDEEVMLLL